MTKPGINIFLLNAFPDKKIKSFGNKLMLNIKKHKYLIDLYIEKLQYLFPHSDIHIINGFDKKKLKKHVSTNYKNIKLLDHDIEEKNICKSILCGLTKIDNKKDYLFISSQYLFNKNFHFNTMNSGIFLLDDNNYNDIGCIINEDTVLNCYYGLNYSLLDIIYFKHTDATRISDLIKTLRIDIEKYFLFELVNLCVSHNIKLCSNFIKHSSIDMILESKKYIKC